VLVVRIFDLRRRERDADAWISRAFQRFRNTALFPWVPRIRVVRVRLRHLHESLDRQS
jgi:hypothetical protein